MLYTPYIWPLLFASGLMAGISFYVLRAKYVPAARPFSLMMAAGAAWALTYALAISTVWLPWRIFWGNCTLFFAMWASLEVLIMVVEYIGQGHWLNKKRVMLLAALPIANAVLIFTSPFHTLYRYNFRLDHTYDFSGLLFSTGPLYSILIGFLILANLISITLLISSALRRRQGLGNSLLISLGILFPLISGLIYALGLSPIRGFDFGPLALVFTGLFAIIGLVGGRLLNVAFVARDLVMENIADVAIILDNRRNIVDLNLAAKHVLAISAGRFTGTTPDALPAAWAELFRRFPDLTARREEVTVGADEGQRVYDLTISPILDGRARQLGWLFLLHDITERKVNEVSLRESEEKFRRLAETSANGMYIYDGERFVIVNPAFLQITGYSEADLAGMNPLDIIHPEHREMVRERVAARLKGDLAPQRYEVKIVIHDRTTRWVDLSVGVVNYRGKPAALGTFMDITERKRTEEALFESESRMRAIADSAWDAILMMDPQGRVSYWNPAAERILGYTQAEAVGQALHDLIAPQRYHPAQQAAFPEFFRSGRGDALGNLHEIYARRKDMSEIPIQLSLSAFQMNGSWYAVGIISDISERKRLEEELKKQATVDELTGVFNRRHFLDLALGELKRSLRLDHPLAIAMMDIDYFKSINDTFGHASGDQALATFTRLCRMHIREIDVFARFGGDEFALLLPETDAQQAYSVVERIRQTLADAPLNIAGRQVALTISSGIAALELEDESLDNLLARTDKALYQAKAAGRNQTGVEHASV